MPRKPLYYDSENGKKEVLGTSGSFEQVPDAPTSALPTETVATYSAMQTSITSDPTTKRDFFVSADETNGGGKSSYRYDGGLYQLSGLRKVANVPLYSAPVLATTLPTSTQQLTGTSSITSAVNIASSNVAFRYQSPVYTWASNTACKVLGSTTGSLLSRNMCITFWSDAPVLEIYIVRYNCKYEIRVNGQYIQQSAFSLDSNGSPCLHKLDWGTTRTPRKYEIFGFNLPFGGLYVGPNDTVWYPDEDDVKSCLGFLGDSYTLGTGTFSARQAWAGQLCDILGYEYAGDGLGGAGWNTASPGDPASRIGQYLGVLPKKPMAVITGLGYNDAGGNMTTLQTSYTSCIAQIRSLIPGARIITLGPWTPVSATANLTTVKTTLQGLCTSLNTRFIDIENFINTSNKTVYGAGDNVHPNAAGHAYLAQRIALLLREQNL